MTAASHAVLLVEVFTTLQTDRKYDPEEEGKENTMAGRKKTEPAPEEIMEENALKETAEDVKDAAETAAKKPAPKKRAPRKTQKKAAPAAEEVMDFAADQVKGGEEAVPAADMVEILSEPAAETVADMKEEAADIEEAVDNAADAVEDTFDDAADSVRKAVDSLKDEAEKVSEDIAAEAEDAADAAGDAAESISDSASERARRAKEKAAEQARKASQKASEKASEVRTSIKNWVPGPNLPNQLTIARICMIPVFVALLLWMKKPAGNILAMIVFIIASLTDTADGYIARRYNYVSTFGKFMDPLADKLLVCSALICLVDLGRIESWIVIIIIAREFIISGFRLIAVEKGVVIAANYWGKFKTVFQMLMVILMVANFGGVFNAIAQVLKWIALALTVISLVTYLMQNKQVLHDVE